MDFLIRNAANELTSAIAKREGKKHQASIGDIREIINILIDLQIEHTKEAMLGPTPFHFLMEAFILKLNKSVKPAKKKKRKK